MEWSLFDSNGRRKYLTASERARFIEIASSQEENVAAFCLTLAFTGARISEVLALTIARVDQNEGCVVFETLKRRASGIYRAIPVPIELIDRLLQLADSARICNPTSRIWSFRRTTAWKHVKRVLLISGVTSQLAKPRALRHAFGVGAVQQRIALSVVKKWLGHAKIETTAIYADPIGDEERALARLMWQSTRTQTMRNLERS